MQRSLFLPKRLSLSHRLQPYRLVARIQMRFAQSDQCLLRGCVSADPRFLLARCHFICASFASALIGRGAFYSVSVRHARSSK
jgi:hypothetical protein